ncbi:tripeptide aminopeptidase [Amaricoccus macauensis]|uniref:Peptidase T n=1 Tax=Amaricoccus macauensis TaxID=57001 RepID=A0A840SM68_9RHOB|nr:peptidase T [Amaricoccus macauensis]MBB5221830.1 tripeptide aminopeptidase [Amaricoccus macauensis]
MEMERELEERLLRYTAIDTQSDETSPTSPSTERQLVLLRLLRDELLTLGVPDVRLTDYGTVIATLPGTVQSAPTIALLAHVDTAPQFHASGVKPVVHRSYDGGTIGFADAQALTLSPTECPYLADRVGDDIITASGKTLLGADDKAGVAIIMTVAGHLLADPTIARGPLRIAFTPDEEIGRGVHPELPKDLAAAVGYTLDGADRGEICYESFSADKAVVTIRGVSIHPGWARGKLVNALHLAAKIVDTLPQATRTPETTDGRDGFIHLYEMTGSAAEAELHFILRDFELDGLAAHGALVRQVAEAVAATEPRAEIEVTITPQYRNMRYWLEKDMRPVELARQACRDVGVEPYSEPIRGGTDGSRLTEMGIPCPNLFTGMQMIHGPREWISVQDMAASTRMVLRLVELWGNER